MTDLQKRLAGPVALTASGATYYTVPSLTSTVVRNIHVINQNAAIITFTLGIGGVTAALSLYYQFSVPSLGAVDWSGFLVLNAGETVQALCGNVSSIILTMSGIEIS